MEAYFTVESISGKSDITFHILRTRLAAVVNARIQNGEYTERGLAKILGVSQPQLHNVLKGARTLQWNLADRLLKHLAITLVDLFTDEEIAAGAHRRNTAAQSHPQPRHGWDREIPRKQPGYELGVGRMRRIDHAAGL
jgi:hypothetical protein